MIIKFKRDYTGRETAMKEYKAGTQVDLPVEQALELVRLGMAVEIWAEIGKMYDPPKSATPVEPETKEEAQPTTAKKTRKGKGKS